MILPNLAARPVRCIADPDLEWRVRHQLFQSAERWSLAADALHSVTRWNQLRCGARQDLTPESQVFLKIFRGLTRGVDRPPRFIAPATLVGVGLKSSGGEIDADYNSAPPYHQWLT